MMRYGCMWFETIRGIVSRSSKQRPSDSVAPICLRENRASVTANEGRPLRPKETPP
jgi:hypothetical protein